MTDLICIHTAIGPFGAVTGYGANQLEAKRNAEKAVAAQEAQIERERQDRERVKRQDARRLMIDRYNGG